MVFCEEIKLLVSKRVNIMGAAPNWTDTPENDGYIWGVNNTHFFREVDLIVDIHKNRYNPVELKDRGHMKILRQKNIPTYAIHEVDGQLHIMRYPLEEIIEEFGEDYFDSGIDYMIALAIYMGAEEIHLYGVWMKGGTEYAHQKASCEYWIGFGRGRGIKVEPHGEGSTLLRTRNGCLYGYGIPQKWVKKYKPEQYELLSKYVNADTDNS